MRRMTVLNCLDMTFKQPKLLAQANKFMIAQR